MSTSSDTYQQIADSGLLKCLQLAIFNAMREHGSMTDNEIAAKIGKPRDTASPRVRELIKRQVVHVVGERKCTVTGLNCRVVALTGKPPAPGVGKHGKGDTARIPRAVLRKVLAGIDAVMRNLFIGIDERRQGNEARQLLSDHL